MASVRQGRGSFYIDEEIRIRDILLLADGTYALQSDVASIDARIYDHWTGEIVDEPDVVVSQAIFDSPQEDGYWDSEDGSGFNFSDGLLSENWGAKGGRLYRAVYRCSMTSGDIKVIDALLTCMGAGRD